jgi:hypothetical protein
MRSFLALALITALLSGCGSIPERNHNTILGSAAGAGAGALVGMGVGGPPAAWLGAGVGSVAGGVIGYLIRPEGCFVQYQNGELWQVDCKDQPVRETGCYVGNEIIGLQKVACPYRPQRRPARPKTGEGNET